VLASIVAAAAAAVVVVIATTDAGFVIAATLSSPLSPSPLPSLSPLPSRRWRQHRRRCHCCLRLAPPLHPPPPPSPRMAFPPLSMPPKGWLLFPAAASVSDAIADSSSLAVHAMKKLTKMKDTNSNVKNQGRK